MTGRRTRWLFVLLLILAPGSVKAQVGHDPESSPYRDVRSRQSLTGTVGLMFGSAGKPGVGPSDGVLVGGRWDIRLSGPTDAFVSLGLADLDRTVIDPRLAPDDRIVAQVKQTVYLAEAGIAILLTGPKTWHGIAPFVGASLGLAIGENVPEDLSGFEFNTKFVIGPAAGIKWFPSDRIAVRFEARDPLWQLSYPLSFFDTPEFAPGADPVLNPDVDGDTEWTHHPTLSISIGYAF